MQKSYGDERRSILVQTGRCPGAAAGRPACLPNRSPSFCHNPDGYALPRVTKLTLTSLNYRAGDEFQHAARGRSNEQAVFLDSRGRAYSLSAHTLPSARSQGEPLSSRFTLPAGESFLYTLAGSAEQKIVLASSFGYGFVTELGNLHSRMKAGKAALSVPAGRKTGHAGRTTTRQPRIPSSAPPPTVTCWPSRSRTFLSFPRARATS